MGFKPHIPKGIRQQIDRLPGRYRQRFKKLIDGLTTTPRPANAQPLHTGEDRYRIRVDNYRLVYRIFDDLLIVEVLNAGKKEGPAFYEKFNN